MLRAVRHFFWPCCPSFTHRAPEGAGPSAGPPDPPRDRVVNPPATALAPGLKSPGTRASPCRVRIQKWDTWKSPGGDLCGALNLSLTNHGSQDVPAGWTLDVDIAGIKSLSQNWNWTPSLQPGKLTGRGTESWQAMKPKESANLGVTLVVDDPGIQITGARLNGEVCALEAAGAP